MADHINDGGPAFPHLRRHISGIDGGFYEPIAEGGMSFRDYCAVAAMQAFFQSEMVTQACGDAGPDQWMKGVARMAYDAADRMIEARGTTEGGAL
jgi:hypothetical protein